MLCKEYSFNHVMFQDEDTMRAVAKLNNKKIGTKNVAVRYAKQIDPVSYLNNLLIFSNSLNLI